MNSFLQVICLTCLVVGVFSAPQLLIPRDVTGTERPWAILRQAQDVNFDGNYVFSYETENGISVEERSVVKNSGTEEQTQTVEGSYSYTAPDGTKYSTRYIADENGFRAFGPHIDNSKPPNPSRFINPR